MIVPWTNDGKKRGAPSSIDVLMSWLSRPGNYEKWESHPKKLAITEEIVKEMKAQGIMHRSPNCLLQDVQLEAQLLKREEVAPGAEVACFVSPR